MKIKLSIIIIVFNLSTTAQVHQFGAGIGQGEGIREIKLEGIREIKNLKDFIVLTTN